MVLQAVQQDVKALKCASDDAETIGGSLRQCSKWKALKCASVALKNKKEGTSGSAATGKH